ncbi:hypothetical protein [Undibacterium terreum]|uniref:Uncharacterized protein n=1 Tax=Undibacterium terreum TaxID=1224302 RepID=A0A916UAH8_9BURK|nr:hypothetical protein [Undibacterium terreum]GGC64604.1 hypothetical protein GCM10011396_09490 [Undibacterium terreum]
MMHSLGLENLFIYAFLIWFIVGLAFLLPKKIKLIKRVGNLSNSELANLAKNGDAEVKKLRRLTWFFVGLGILVLLPLRILG